MPMPITAMWKLCCALCTCHGAADAAIHMHAADTGISKNYVAKWDSVSIGGEQLKVAVVGLHLKAFPTDAKSCAQREGQAAVARATIQELTSSGATTAQHGHHAPASCSLGPC